MDIKEEKMEYTSYVGYLEKITVCVNGSSVPIVPSGDTIAQINEAIQQKRRIVTFYDTLEEYKFDLTGYKYNCIDVQAAAGTVHRYNYETSEIELMLENNFFTKKLIGIDNHNAIKLAWTGEFLEQFKIVTRGLYHIEKDADNGEQIAILDKFVCFDLIPKGGNSVCRY